MCCFGKADEMRIALWTSIAEIAIYILLAIVSIRLLKAVMGITLILVAVEMLFIKFDTEEGTACNI